MRKIKLTREERMIDEALVKGELKPVSREEFKEIAEALAVYKTQKKDAVLNIRVNNNDLQLLKDKAKKLGVKYQTFISEILHRIAHT